MKLGAELNVGVQWRLQGWAQSQSRSACNLEPGMHKNVWPADCGIVGATYQTW